MVVFFFTGVYTFFTRTCQEPNMEIKIREISQNAMGQICFTDQNISNINVEVSSMKSFFQIPSQNVPDENVYYNSRRLSTLVITSDVGIRVDLLEKCNATDPAIILLKSLNGADLKYKLAIDWTPGTSQLEFVPNSTESTSIILKHSSNTTLVFKAGN